MAGRRNGGDPLTLSMDIDTLRAALLFPLADGEVVSEEVMQESVGKSVVTLIHGVRTWPLSAS